MGLFLINIKVSFGRDLVPSNLKIQTTYLKESYYFVAIEYTGSATFSSLKASMTFLGADEHVCHS